jgi:hypothetical protein
MGDMEEIIFRVLAIVAGFVWIGCVIVGAAIIYSEVLA